MFSILGRLIELADLDILLADISLVAVGNVGQIPDLHNVIGAQDASIEHLRADLKLVRVGHILKSVRAPYNSIATLLLVVGIGHYGHSLRQLKRKRLDLALIVRAPSITDGLVLKHVLITSEVIQHAGLNQLHLIGVNDLRGGLDLLHVGVCIGEQCQAAGVRAEVFVYPILALVGKVFALCEVVDRRHKAEACAVFDALCNCKVGIKAELVSPLISFL